MFAENCPPGDLLFADRAYGGIRIHNEIMIILNMVGKKKERPV
jgi:hypothetical protein